MTENKTNYFTELNAVDCSGKVEQKNGLSYLSWAWAWGELKKRHPTATYTIYEDANGCFYHTDGKTAWVKTGVTVDGIEHIEYLPVMDFKNKSIPVGNVTSFDVNKTIQRSLTKAVARHGLGLYIYAGEDLPEEATETAEATTSEAKTKRATKKAQPTETPAPATSQATTSDATGTTPKAHNAIRAEFVKYCKDYGIKGEAFTGVCKKFKLNNDAPDENFSKALEFCKAEVEKARRKALAEAKAKTEVEDAVDSAEAFLNGIEEV